MLIVALFIRAKNEKWSECLSTGEWIIIFIVKLYWNIKEWSIDAHDMDETQNHYEQKNLDTLPVTPKKVNYIVPFALNQEHTNRWR